MEWGAGDVSGVLPYSRMTKPPGDAVMDVPGDVFLVHRDHFPEMTRECPNVTATLVHVMLDRARRFTSSDLQDEKMMSLGKLSAGLAHELNNPASAAARSARLLTDALSKLEAASRALGAARLSPEQSEAIHQARRICSSVTQSMLSPIERSDREDALTEWLDAHGRRGGIGRHGGDGGGARRTGVDVDGRRAHERRWMAGRRLLHARSGRRHREGEHSCP
jgi:signal transduction histidine kinase